MTQFRSKGKGKDRKAYPVNPRKPYGVSREVAYEDVQMENMDYKLVLRIIYDGGRSQWD